MPRVIYSVSTRNIVGYVRRRLIIDKFVEKTKLPKPSSS